jgi:hypothetical protein
MTAFGHLTKEERDEWRSATVTQAALAMLRNLEAMTRDSLIASTDGHDLAIIKYNCGFMRGFQAAVDALITEKK